MSKKLRLLQGGLKSKESSKKEFVSAYVTDTRLMGAMGMYVHWKLADPSYDEEDLHQFFHFDAEEYGFESYSSLWGNDVYQIQGMEQSLINPLGGKKMDLSQKEAAALLKEYVTFNRNHGLDMPSPQMEYRDLLALDAPLSPEEKQLLLLKEYTEIQSEYQLIHYFLMRYFCKDREAAAYLFDGTLPQGVFQQIPTATLCRNNIDEKDGWFLSESLIQVGQKYYITVSRIKVTDKKVSDFQEVSSFKVTPAEASLMLSRSEFITVYEIVAIPNTTEEEVLEFSFNTAITIHDNGKLFIAFHNNNDHVNRRVYRLSEDVLGMYYISDYGQLVVVSYDVRSIRSLEKDILSAPLGRYLIPTEKYEFQEPVFYDFIQSGYESFDDFIDSIRGDE